MNQHQINRRQFVAASAAVTATAAINAPALARPEALQPTKPLPAPSIARVIRSTQNPSAARLSNSIFNPTPSTTPLSTPTLAITPLPCISGRIHTDTSLTIEVLYPTPNAYAILYSAHNIEIKDQSIAAYPASSQINAPRDSRHRVTLRITQQTPTSKRTKELTLPASSASDYLLAIPTARHASNASWRFSSAQLDDSGNITKLTNPLPGVSTRCAYFKLTIEESTGA